MDLKQYYRKIREVEESILERYPLMVSLETSDGGKAGLISEVSRAVAAKLIVEGRAILASFEQQEIYRRQQAIAQEKADSAELARRVQVAFISEADLNASFTGKTPTSSGK